MGSRNLTCSSYAVRSIPCSSKRWERSSCKKSTNRPTSSVDFGGIWSTKLHRTTHLEFLVWGLKAGVLDRSKRGGRWVILPDFGGRRRELSVGVEGKFWRESWRVAIWASATAGGVSLGRWDLEVGDGEWLADFCFLRNFCGEEQSKSFEQSTCSSLSHCWNVHAFYRKFVFLLSYC